MRTSYLPGEGYVCIRLHVFMLQLGFVNLRELGLGTRQRSCFGIFWDVRDF